MPRASSLGEYALIESFGPRAEYVPTTELIAPALGQTAIAASGHWTSELITADGYYDLALGVKSSQAGAITVYRYIDDAGTVPLDGGQTQALTANTLATLIITDGKPCASFKVEVTNTGGASAAIQQFAALMSAH